MKPYLAYGWQPIGVFSIIFSFSQKNHVKAFTILELSKITKYKLYEENEKIVTLISKTINKIEMNP